MQNISALKPPKVQPVDWEALLKGIFRGKTVMVCGLDRNVFRQGDPAESLFYLRRGKVKLSVISPEGKEAIIAILDPGEFFGEGCLAGQPVRMATAVAMTDCTLDKIDKPLMARILHEHHDISELFVTQRESGDSGTDGRHDPVAGQSFHEQVQRARLYRL